MTRYIFCILLGVFFLVGINSILTNHMQEFRTKSGTATNVQYHTQTNYNNAESILQQLSKSNRMVDNEGYTCKTSNGILSSFFTSSRIIPPAKILKSNPTALTIQTLRSLSTQLLAKNWSNLSIHTNFAKTSYRYYIYSLGRILI